MLSKAFITSLRGFFHPILRFLGMTTTPPTQVDVEFPVFSTRVQEWENGLLTRYRSRDLESSPMERSRMYTLKVVTIRRFKEKKHPQHEYLVAEVHDPDRSRYRYLRIERYVGADFPRAQDDTILYSIPTASSQSSLILGKSSALDYVDAISAWPTGDDCIDHLTCKDSQMILLDLAIVAKVVHDHSADYQILTSQCYWYSAVIVSVLRKSFPNSASSLKADHGKDLEVEIFDKKAGTYIRIPIYSERTEVIAEIHDLFKTYKDRIYSSVNLLNTGYNFFANYFLPQIAEAQQYVEQKLDADRKAQQAIEDAERRANETQEEAQKAIEGMQKENERVQKENESVQKENERVQKEKEDAERRANEAQEEAQKAIMGMQKEIERVQKENAALKQRMQDMILLAKQHWFEDVTSAKKHMANIDLQDS